MNKPPYKMTVFSTRILDDVCNEDPNSLKDYSDISLENLMKIYSIPVEKAKTKIEKELQMRDLEYKIKESMAAANRYVFNNIRDPLVQRCAEKYLVEVKELKDKK